MYHNDDSILYNNSNQEGDSSNQNEIEKSLEYLRINFQTQKQSGRYIRQGQTRQRETASTLEYGNIQQYPRVIREPFDNYCTCMPVFKNKFK